MMVKSIIKAIYRYYLILEPKWLTFIYVMTIVAAIIIGFYGKRKNKGFRWISCLTFLFFYMLTVITSTVLSRTTSNAMKINIELLWSWRAAFSGNKGKIALLVGNIIMLCPIGFLLPLINEKRYRAAMTIFIGCFMSVIIESSQLLLKRGLFEIDDIINNTIGVAIGYAASVLMCWCVKHIKVILKCI